MGFQVARAASLWSFMARPHWALLAALLVLLAVHQGVAQETERQVRTLDAESRALGVGLIKEIDDEIQHYGELETMDLGEEGDALNLLQEGTGTANGTATAAANSTVEVKANLTSGNGTNATSGNGTWDPQPLKSP